MTLVFDPARIESTIGWKSLSIRAKICYKVDTIYYSTQWAQRQQNKRAATLNSKHKWMLKDNIISVENYQLQSALLRPPRGGATP